MRLTELEQVTFRQHVQSVLLEEKMWQLDEYIQHGQTTRLEHCVAVAYFSYWVYCRLHLQGNAYHLVRGALLHDFFLYDLREERPKNHISNHPYHALENASSCFMLNEEECDIIKNHMWPLTLALPAYKSTLVVSIIDKACAITEFFQLQYGDSLLALGFGVPRPHIARVALRRARNILVLAAKMRP